MSPIQRGSDVRAVKREGFNLLDLFGKEDGRIRKRLQPILNSSSGLG